MTKNNLFNKRLIVITGKGGVGKTTISAVIAIAAKKLGKKVLICEINTQEKIPSMLGYENSNGDIKEIEKNLFTVNIIPNKAMEEYGLMILKSKLIYNTIFNNKYVKKFLSAIPGLSEILIWGKIRYHEQEKTDKGFKYDMIIVDAPATGHGISLLKLPIAILSILQKGALAKEGRALYDLLTDKDKTSVNVVTIPEELPVNEAKELVETVKNELKMPIGNLFINQNVSKLFTQEELKLYKLLKSSNDNDLNILKKSADYRLSREKLNEKYIKEAINKIKLPSVIFPFLFVESFKKKDFEYLADILLKN
jgi:anion-transporting  ArsA/GET3 family ATPase